MEQFKQYERFVVGYAAQLVEEQNMSHAQFARDVFGDTDASPVKWRRIRNEGQALTVAELWAVADRLGMKLEHFIWETQKEFSAQCKKE